MNHQTIPSLRSTAPNSIKAEEIRAKLTSNPVYLRSSNASALSQDVSRAKSQNLATDGTGRASSFSLKSMADLTSLMGLAAASLDARMAPGDVIDLGRLKYGTNTGYLCRKTASGDGYVVQTHEQAKSAPFSGMFFPAVNNSNAGITMDMVPVTEVHQLQPPMFGILHSLARFVSRQDISELLMGS